MKILIMGLPGAGKTTLALRLVDEIRKYASVIHWNADEVRQNVNKDLKFSAADRVEQSRRMSWLCDVSLRGTEYAIAEFVCPTEETREVFGADFVIFVDTISEGRYSDTNAIFQSPIKYDVLATTKDAEYWSAFIVQKLKEKYHV